MVVAAPQPGVAGGDRRRVEYVMVTAAIVHQAYRFALDPTPRQQGRLISAVGGARYAFNWGLALVKHRLDERAAGQSVEVPWTLPALRREWNRANTRSLPGGVRTARKATAQGWMGWRERSRTLPMLGTAAAKAAGSASRDSGGVAATTPAGLRLGAR